MSIWFAAPDLGELNRIHEGTAVSALGIRITAWSENSLTGTMPVDHRTKQPWGLLHGGASVLLAETLGSAASMCCVDQTKWLCVGLDVNANHLRGVRDGMVTGVAQAIHLGRTSHVWGIEIRTEDDRLVCVARLTATVIPAPTS
ncbi:MAG TPA: hotdog fold thioesterase [Pseudomonadales bacterium]|nr:hotdog fold thioesterase [Pseudomonadales bacterium]